MPENEEIIIIIIIRRRRRRTTTTTTTTTTITNDDVENIQKSKNNIGSKYNKFFKKNFGRT